MIIILASIADEAAAAFARAFPAGAARLVTCLDLAMEPSALHHPRSETSRLTIGVEVVRLGSIRGVVNLLRVVDPAESQSLSRNTPYRGMTLPGRVVATFLRGRATVLEGKVQ